MNDTAMELRGDTDIVISRTFRAPARIVFEAWTKPELVRRWWAPKCREVELVECTADVRANGKYRYVLSHHGNELAFSGTYREVTPHSRLVYTQIFEPMPTGEAVITIDFDEHDGKTRLVATEVYPSAEVRQQVLASGMEGGMRDSMNQLDELIQSLV
jgi:uncharacterized protein YndB with AHSA1/START domain